MTARLTRQEFLMAGGLGAAVAALGLASNAKASTTCQPAATLTGIPGLRGKDPAGTYYVVPHAGTYDPYWSTVAHGSAEIGRILGVKVIFEAPEHYDPGQQASMLTAAASAGCSGIATTGAAAQAMLGPLRTAQEAGVPVIFFDTPPPPGYAGRFVDGQPLGFVGTDIRFAAAQVSGEVAPLLSSGAHVVIINHEPGNPILDLKARGFVDGLASKSPRVSQLNVGEELTRSVEILRSFYAANKDITAVFALGAIGNAVAVKFLDEQGLSPQQLRIGGSDVDEFTLHALQDGKMVATIGLPSYLFGALPVVMLYFYNAFGVDPGLYQQTSGQLVTKAQVPQFLALSKLGLR
jgi:simple sugar transport system substrate-binding protein